MAHKLKARLDRVDAILNPPPPVTLRWCAADPTEFEPGVIYVRWRAAEEEAAANAGRIRWDLD